MPCGMEGAGRRAAFQAGGLAGATVLKRNLQPAGHTLALKYVPAALATVLVGLELHPLHGKVELNSLPGPYPGGRCHP